MKDEPNTRARYERELLRLLEEGSIRIQDMAGCGDISEREEKDMSEAYERFRRHACELADRTYTLELLDEERKHEANQRDLLALLNHQERRKECLQQYKETGWCEWCLGTGDMGGGQTCNVCEGASEEAGA